MLDKFITSHVWAFSPCVPVVSVFEAVASACGAARQYSRAKRFPVVVVSL